MSRKPDWMKEAEAASMLGYQPETLRKKVKAGKLNVAFTNLNNRNWQYDRKDLEKVLLENSTFIA